LVRTWECRLDAAVDSLEFILDGNMGEFGDEEGGLHRLARGSDGTDLTFFTREGSSGMGGNANTMIDFKPAPGAPVRFTTITIRVREASDELIARIRKELGL
jgi:hypothetical protein